MNHNRRYVVPSPAQKRKIDQPLCRPLAIPRREFAEHFLLAHFVAKTIAA